MMNQPFFLYFCNVMKVMKFGGTSVGSASRIKAVAELVSKEKAI